MTDSSPLPESDDICIIGMAGRFPGARNLDEFWQNLRAGTESLTELSDEELRSQGVPAELLENQNYVKTRAILDDIESFDGAFFGYSPREAERIDPQQRFFLECSWEALEAAGYDPATYAGRIGVYAGVGTNNYPTWLSTRQRSQGDLLRPYDISIANDKDFLTTRVAYKLNLNGPAVTIQTACSTSLVAVHLACQSLLTGECDMALAGGVTIHVPQRIGYLYHEGGLLAPDGHCRAFDSAASGLIPGSGVGVVVLKRLADAIADGDTIDAVIKGSAINNDGAAKIGFTAPSVTAQAQVIGEAYGVANISPESVSYIETHGAGTPLGDPIEVAALSQAFGAYTKRTGFCAIGSVKTNVGHLDAAAGVAGLIKTVLALKQQELPPSLNFSQPNPEIDFEQTPFYVNTELKPWHTDAQPRRAGVTSLGIGGTNAHVVLEEAPALEPEDSGRPMQILPLSAQSAPALEHMTERLIEYLRHEPAPIADVAYTLQVGRAAMPQRRVVCVECAADAITALEALKAGEVWTGEAAQTDRSIVFMFPGGGAQYLNMGRELYLSEPVFRAEVDRCADLLADQANLDLRAVLYPTAEQSGEQDADLEQTETGLPALFAVEYALARLLISWGITPSALIGHSLGEYTAACLAGVFSLEDALALVVLRARLFARLPHGAMLSVPLSEEHVQPLLENPQLSLAAVNGPSACVIAGPSSAIDELQQTLKEQDIEARRLKIAVAAHSQMIDEILDAFSDRLHTMSLSAPQVPFVSNVTGTWIEPAEASDPQYWARHLRQTVRFAAGISAIMQDMQDGNPILLEVGPGQTLGTLARQNMTDARSGEVLATLPHPLDRSSDLKFLLSSVGQLWIAGVAIDWQALHASERRVRVPLPTYPFERERFWIEPAETDSTPDALERRANLDDWFYVPAWNRGAPLPPAMPPAEPATNLIFAERGTLGWSLAEALRQRGEQVIVVTAGAALNTDDPQTFTVDPASSDDYLALCTALKAADRVPSRIIHAWTARPREAPPTDFAEVIEAQHSGFYSLLWLCQALEKQGLKQSMQLIAITGGVHAVTGDETEHAPEHAPMVAACRVIAQEYSHIACRAIDVTLPRQGSTQAAALIDQLAADVFGGTEDVVAYRGRHRWLQSFAPYALGPDTEPPARLKPQGVYLITGGLGGIGLLIARYLAQSVQARLVLVNRSSLPEREHWDRYLDAAQNEEQDSSEESPDLRERIKAVQELEALGAEVLLIQADISDAAQVRQVVEQAHERFGPIQGVVHTAAIAGGGMIALTNPAAINAEFAPKIGGALALASALKDEPLDLVLYCSSLNALIGGVGQIAYCAANAFLDSFAAQASAGQLYSVSVNWDRWRGVGLAVDVEQRHTTLLGELIKGGMAPEEGVAAFAQILRGTAPQVIVSTQEFQTLLNVETASGAAEALNVLEASSPPTARRARPRSSTTYAPPADADEQQIAEIWQGVLGIDEIGADDHFFQLGGDSLIGLQVITRMRDSFQVDLGVRDLFDAPTPRQLAATVKQLRGDQQPDTQTSVQPIERRDNKTIVDLLEELNETD